MEKIWAQMEEVILVRAITLLKRHGFAASASKWNHTPPKEAGMPWTIHLSLEVWPEYKLWSAVKALSWQRENLSPDKRTKDSKQAHIEFLVALAKELCSWYRATVHEKKLRNPAQLRVEFQLR